MRAHPATLMLITWGVAFLLLNLLPFHIVNRDLSVFGYAMIALALMCFCGGALLRSPIVAVSPQARSIAPDFQRSDIVFPVIAVIAIASALWELRSGADLDALWQVRNARAGAIISGENSGSSLSFQILFMLSPVAYTIIAREIIFRPVINLVRLGIFGFGPLIGSALALGGRGPLLFGITFALFAYLSRPKAAKTRARKKMTPRTFVLAGVSIVFALVALNYFATVFFVRAGDAGAQGMLDLTGDTWGVMFDGPTAEAMKSTLGVGTTYLIFVFVWYLVQGIVIANVLFTSYADSPHLGIYGVELVTALFRRIDGNFVAMRFLSLDSLNVVGFLPSAFGSLFVDVLYFAFPIIALWGYLTGMVYNKTRRSADARWALAAPFVIQGIVFSLLNTPIGLTNGLVSHSWMILMFIMAKQHTRTAAAPSASKLAYRA
jgi:hypothetical protein